MNGPSVGRAQGAPKVLEAKRANWPHSVFNDDGMAVCGFLGIFMTLKVLGSLSKFSDGSIKPMKMISEQENNFWKDFEKGYSSMKLLKDIFDE